MCNFIKKEKRATQNAIVKLKKRVHDKLNILCATYHVLLFLLALRSLTIYALFDSINIFLSEIPLLA